jgi:1-acyl-sn-glycerol-3-phosphate acyltransferase
MSEARAVGGTAPLKARMRVAYEFGVLHSSLLLLASICLSWSLLTLPLYPLLPRRVGSRFGRFGIMAGFRLFRHWLRFVGAFRLDLSAVEALRGGPPLILAPNHPCLIDALLILTCLPNLACVMKSELMGNILLGPGARLARYIRNESTRQMVREAVDDLRAGGMLLLFPEGTRTTRGPVNRLSRSVAVIAKHARVPVQTLIIETDSAALRKGTKLTARPTLPITYQVRLGRRFDPPQDVERFMDELERHYRQELQGSPTAPWINSQARR